MSYFWIVVCVNLFFRRRVFCVLFGDKFISVEIDGFGTVSIVRKSSISAFCEQISFDDEDFVARFDGKH